MSMKAFHYNKSETTADLGSKPEKLNVRSKIVYMHQNYRMKLLIDDKFVPIIPISIELV